MKVLVVDDEYFVRKGIQSIVDQMEWAEVVGEAENGVEAIEEIVNKSPDLVFLDITMPKKSGLEVLEDVRTHGYKGFITILTSHDDFSFVQQALRKGANDYVLKNELVGNKMSDYLQKMMKKIAQKNREEVKVNTSQTNDLNNMKEKFLKSLFRDGNVDFKEFESAKKEFDIHFNIDRLYLIQIKIHNWKEITNRYKSTNLKSLYASISQITKDSFGESSSYDTFFQNQNVYTILYSNSIENSIKNLELDLSRKINRLLNAFMTLMNAKVTIGVFRNTSTIKNLNRSFHLSEELLTQSYFYPDKNIFYRTATLFQRDASYKILEEKVSNDQIASKKISARISEFLKQNEGSYIEFSKFNNLVMDWLEGLYLLTGYKTTSVLSEYENVIAFLDDIKKVEHIVEERSVTVEYSYITKKAITIINEHFTEDISLDEIAEALKVNPSYFSRLFSQETKVTFSNYLIHKRIEYAKELIISTNDKLYVISEKSGFNSAVHFNNTFKKVTGLTPNQFRKKFYPN